MPEVNIDFPGGYTPKSWDTARGIVGSLGPFPSSFTSVIRLLVNDHDRAISEPSVYGSFFVSRFLNAPSILAPYYYALKSTKPEMMKDPQGILSNKDILKACTNYEHAAMLSVIFTFRHAKRISTPTVFDTIVPRFARATTLAWHIGQAIPGIGAGNAMLMGAFRVLGLVPLVKADPSGFMEYWSHLHYRRAAIDHDFEFARWGCNSLQLGTLLCQKLGFGLARALPLMRALTCSNVMLADDELERAFRITDVWLEALIAKKTAPAIPLPARFYPDKKALELLSDRASLALGSSDNLWILKDKTSLTPELSPQLFNGPDPLISQAGAENSPQVPQDLSETLPIDTINELSKKLIQDVMQSDES